MKELGALIGSLIIGAAVIIYGVCLSGLLLYKFWYWFVLPPFADLPRITYGAAVGLCFFITLFKSSRTEMKDEYKDPNDNGTKYVLPWVVLLIGYLFHLCIG